MNDRSNLGFTPRLVLGLFIALAGALLLLDNLGIVESRHYFHFWPVLLIALGIARVLQPPTDRGRGFGYILIFVGTWLLIAKMGWAGLRTDLLWPALILLLGLHLIWREFARRRFPAPGRASDPRDRIDAFALLGGSRQMSSSPAFLGGTATAVMGGCEIDLRHATLAAGGAVLDVFAMWGGVDVTVPEDWDVQIQGTPILGAFEEKPRRVAASQPDRLIVRGVAIMGGVEVKYKSRDDQ